MNYAAARLIRLGGALTVLVLLGSCTITTVTPEKVTGTYRGRFTGGTELLVLRENGRYEETFTFPDGRMVKNEGTWQQDRPEHPRRVSLSSAIVRGQFGEAPKRDREFIPVSIGSNAVELQATPDPDGANTLRSE